MPTRDQYNSAPAAELLGSAAVIANNRSQSPPLSYAAGSKPSNMQGRRLESVEMDSLAIPSPTAVGGLKVPDQRTPEDSARSSSVRSNFPQISLQSNNKQDHLGEKKRPTCKEVVAKCQPHIGSYHYENHGKKTEYDIRSLMIFHGSWRPRKWLVWLVEWKWFENFITLIILANSVMLACTDYGERLYGEDYVSQRNLDMTQVDTAFSIIFTFECVSKILAMGFFMHKKSYLRDIWNWLDFFVVMISVIGWLPGIESSSSLKSLRTFRILRPLRSINSMPRMKALIKTLLFSLAGLVNVGLFLAFVFTIFAIFGTH